MMDQTHIGYTSWDEPKGGNIMPKVTRVDASRNGNMVMGGYEYEESSGVVVMEAERLLHPCRNPVHNGLLYRTWDVHSPDFL